MTDSAPTLARPVASEAPAALPPLENGDHLTRHEFERRYAAMPHLKKAELIEGVTYLGSPVRLDHAEAHSLIIGWLFLYKAATPAMLLADNATVRLDADNEVQPDALLTRLVAQGGQVQISPDDYLAGAPDLIVEIAGSSAAYDLHNKWQLYRRAGVREYVVWQLYEQRLDWWHLHEGRYLPLDADAAGLACSRVLPGLCLDIPALLGGDVARVMAAVQAGTQSEAHAAFVAQLQETSQGSGGKKEDDAGDEG